LRYFSVSHFTYSQDRAKDRSLNDSNLILDQSDDENDELDSVSEGDVEQGSPGVTHATSYTLGSMRKKACQGDDRDGIHGKDHSTVSWLGHL